MFRNVSGQKIAIYAHDITTGLPKTGDAANITARVSLDGAGAAQTNDVNPTELDATYMKGIYLFDLTQAETDAGTIVLVAVSATSGVVIEPVMAYTQIVTPTLAAYLNKLNVTGTLAHTDNADTFKADISALALEATLTAIKGGGWTTETLKAIYDAIGALNDPTAADIEAAIAAAHGVGAYDGSGTGLRTVTIQIYETATVTPIGSVYVQIWNSGETAIVCDGTTDENGQLVVHLDDGTYSTKKVKVGVSFTASEAITVSADGTKTQYGSPIAIPTPDSADACTIYEYLIGQDDSTKASDVDATAQIITLPYDFGGKLHAGDIVEGTYVAATGRVTWSIAKGARVRIVIKGPTGYSYGVDKLITVPDAASARVADL